MQPPEPTLEERFEQFLTERELLHPREHVLLAVSGGCDSMTMLHLFTLLRQRWGLGLSIAHINHQLRGAESFEDEQFVREVAELLGLPILVTRLHLGDYRTEEGHASEARARHERYAALEAMRNQLGASRIATAHHADDNAETILMNLARGTGLRGLAGIPASRDGGRVIRPLLFARRAELRAFAASNDIRFREDSSNASLAYTRNIYRHKVLPLLGTLSGSDPVEGLIHLSATVAGIRQRIEQEVDHCLARVASPEDEGVIRVQIPQFRAEAEYLQQEMVLEILRRLGVEESARKVAAVLGLCSKPTGRQIDLGRNLVATRDRDRLLFQPTRRALPLLEPIELGKSYEIRGHRFSSRVVGAQDVSLQRSPHHAYVDGARLTPQMVLRSWNPGDAFIPLGMSGRKKLSDFFANEKIPKFQKSSVPLLESNGTIVWVCGMRIDDRFKVTPSTTSFVELRYTPMAEETA